MASEDDNDGLKQSSLDFDDIENTELEIDVIDDTPEVDRNRKPLKDDIEDVSEDELNTYDEKVQKRIKSAHRKMHDERRAKEAALREREEAVTFAQRIYGRAKELERQLSVGSEVYIDKANSEADFALDAAKREYKEAYENGDADRLVEAQEKITRAITLKDNAKTLRPLTVKEEPEYTQPQREPEVQLDDKQKAWLTKNPWFTDDGEEESIMHVTALGLHKSLVNSGMDPNSDEYYEAIDARMRQRFPDYFSANNEYEEKPRARTKPATVVASARRSTAPRKVTLNQSQINLAKRLGITPELYAREVLKRAKEQNSGR